MRHTTYNKLVRDRIPEIIRSDGRVPHTRTLSPEEHRTALLKKLREEEAELAQAGPEKKLDELVDVLEVLKSLAEALNLSWDQVEEVRERKRSERGGFQQRIFLESTEET